LDVNEFNSKIKTLPIGGCFIFAGEEDYLKRYYLSQLRRRIVTEEFLAPFNHSVYDGREVDFAAIRDAILSPPMMSDGKLIEWKYPSFDKMKESDLEAFEDVLDLLDSHDYATLAFIVEEGEIDLGTPKKEGKFTRRFGKRVNILNFPKSTDASLMSWLKKHFDAEKIEVTAPVLRDLIFRSGHSMSVLNNEVAKLSAYAKANGRTSVGSEDVNMVASSTPESDTFALSDAILARNKSAAFAALLDMKTKRLDPVMIMGMMSKTYSELTAVSALVRDGLDSRAIAAELKMNSYKCDKYVNAAKRQDPAFYSAALEELLRVDYTSKYGGVAGYAAIELFIAKWI
jgi:DNA polymerase-3 subunit delta